MEGHFRRHTQNLSKKLHVPSDLKGLNQTTDIPKRYSVGKLLHCKALLNKLKSISNGISVATLPSVATLEKASFSVATLEKASFSVATLNSK